MSGPLPIVTVIIPTRPDLSSVQALEGARRLDYPREKLEIILARGKQPSVQRNAALKTAAGEIIYFLDDDSLPAVENLRQAIPRFADASVKMVGGPNLCPPDAPSLEKAFALTMGSWLAFGPSRARYRSLGQVRSTSEKELILCNLLARRDALLELGGFNEALYPNEENALMDELQKRGGKLIYDPALIVHRRPRRTLRAFGKMLLNYGRGRAEQFRSHPTPGSALNFVPPLFCVFLVAAPFLGKLAAIPALAYLAVVLAQAFVTVWPNQATLLPHVTLLIILVHVLYGLGFWRGLFTKLRRATPTSAEVKLERIQPIA